MKSSSKYIIAVDTETSGLPSKENKPFYNIALIEATFCVIDMETLTICEEVDIMLENNYKEGLIYQSQAEEVHGITESIRIAKGKPLKDCLNVILGLFKKYKNPRQGITLVAHNYQFDKPFIQNFFEYMEKDLDEYVKYWHDTMQWAHMALPESTDYKLNTCCSNFGIDLVDAHRSSSDTRATANLFIEYVKRLRGEGIATKQETNRPRYRESFQLL